MKTETETETPLFSVGVIADIQYAPIPDGFSYKGTPRYYRHSLQATKDAFEVFRDYDYRWHSDADAAAAAAVDDDGVDNGNGVDNDNGVDLVVNLGDIIDGKCQEMERYGGSLRSSPASATFNDLSDHQGMLALLEIKDAMTPYCDNSEGHNHNPRKILHSYGNHCLYNLNRTELRETLGIPFRIERPMDDNGTSSRGDSGTGGDCDTDCDCDCDYDGDLVGYYSYVYPPHPASTTDPSSSTAESSSPDCNTNNNGRDNGIGIKFIVLDGYDIALMRRSATHSSKRRHAVEILQRENGKNFGDGNENSPEGLEGLQERFVAFNGAVGPAQLLWLRNELETTRNLNSQEKQTNNNNNNNCDGATIQTQTQKVVILSHQPIHPGSSNPVCLIWNYDSVLELLREFSDVVIASFAGHAHKGGYCRDEESGIHFRVIEAVLESKPPTTTFGVLNVYRNKLHLRGYGDCKSAIYRFDEINQQ